MAQGMFPHYTLKWPHTRMALKCGRVSNDCFTVRNEVWLPRLTFNGVFWQERTKCLPAIVRVTQAESQPGWSINAFTCTDLTFKELRQLLLGIDNGYGLNNHLCLNMNRFALSQYVSQFNTFVW